MKFNPILMGFSYKKNDKNAEFVWKQFLVPWPGFYDSIQSKTNCGLKNMVSMWFNCFFKQLIVTRVCHKVKSSFNTRKGTDFYYRPYSHESWLNVPWSCINSLKWRNSFPFFITIHIWRFSNNKKVNLYSVPEEWMHHARAHTQHHKGRLSLEPLKKCPAASGRSSLASRAGKQLNQCHHRWFGGSFRHAARVWLFHMGPQLRIGPADQNQTDPQTQTRTCARWVRVLCVCVCVDRMIESMCVCDAQVCGRARKMPPN